jgi:hypothetical protein
MALTLEELGVTQEKLLDMVVDRFVDTFAIDGDGFETKVAKECQKQVGVAVDAAIAKLAEQHILPNVAQYIENVTLQETTKWGEKKGEPKTFIEYLIARAENYLTETVDYEGRAKAERETYSWSGKQTRITFLVHQHLQYSIENAMKAALVEANSQIANGIAETVKLKLGEITQKLSAKVDFGR